MTIQQQTRVGALEVPAEFQIKHIDEAYVQCIRPDQLTVFLDRGSDEVSTKLNYVRIHGTKEQVVKTVGLVRGMQAALNFAMKYCDELAPQLRDDIHRALSHIKVLSEP